MREYSAGGDRDHTQMSGPDFNPLGDFFRTIFTSIEFLQGIAALMIVLVVWIVIRIAKDR
jgi:hypothetical protein